MASLINYAERLPRPVAKALPYSLLALLLALSGLYGYSSYLENHRRKALVALIARFKALLSARATYLRITSHYINTPVTKMQGVIELLSSGVITTTSSASTSSTTNTTGANPNSATNSPSSTNTPDGTNTPTTPPANPTTPPNTPSSPSGSSPSASAHLAATSTSLTIPEGPIVAAQSAIKSLTNHAAELLDEGQSLTGRQQASIHQLEKQKGLSFLTHPAFWLPVTVISTLTVLLNIIFIQAHRYPPTAITIASQLLLGFVGVIALAVSYYFYSQAKRQKQTLATQQSLETDFNARQTSFITEAANKLSDDLLILEGVAKDIAKYPKTTSFSDGLAELKTVINQLAKFSQLTKIVPGLSYQTDLSKSLASATSNLQPLADKQSVTITSQQLVPGTLVDVEDQALDHLLSAPLKNAIQASNQGSQVTISQSANPKDKHHPILLTISDTGKGIPASKLADIFTPFNSAHSLERFSDTGLGLDLYLAKVLAEAYGLTLDLASTEGQGSVVSLGMRRSLAK